MVIDGFAASNELRVGFLYPLSNNEHDNTVDLPFASAFTVALDAINESSSLLPSTELTFLWNDTKCDETIALKAMTEQFFRRIDAFIGPGNASYCSTAARVAAAWNIPMISYVSILVISRQLTYNTPLTARALSPVQQAYLNVVTEVNDTCEVSAKWKEENEKKYEKDDLN